MQSTLNDKENQILTIALDFKKKGKSKPTSDRTNSNSSQLKSPNTKIANNNTIALLEKKKQYSQTLREKNCQKQGKKSRHSQTLQDKIKNQTIQLQGDTLKLASINLVNYNSEYSTRTLTGGDSKQNSKSTVYVSSFAKKEQKGKLRDVRRQRNKLQQQTMFAEDSKRPSLSSNFSILSISENYPQRSMMNPDISLIEKIDELSHIYRYSQICAQQIDYCLGPFQTEQTKEAEMTKKQNNTYKKQLANFRKQNAALKRQADQLKKKLATHAERNQYLETQSTQQFALIESLQNKVNQSAESITRIEKKAFEKQAMDGKDENEEKLKEIIANYENELFQATNTNKKLSFRNYILEKRLMDEAEIHKKTMAKEVSIWKERYIKARNQNLRLKDSRSSTLFEMSFSQEM